MLKTDLSKKAALFVVITISLMALSLLTMGSVSIWKMHFDTVGQMQKQDADLFSRFIDQQIDNEIKKLRSYAADLWWREEVEKANRRYLNWEPKAIKEYMERMDEQWINVKDSKPVREILDSHLSWELTEQVGIDGVIAEMTLTDRYGGLVATSGKISDYYQGDENWWQTAYDSGAEDVFFGEIILDEANGKIGNAIAFSIRDESGQTIGVVKAVLDFDIFLKSFMHYKFGKTGKAVLMNEDGYLIYDFSSGSMGKAGISAGKLRNLLESKNGFAIIKSKFLQVPSLVAVSRIKSRYLQSSGISWVVVVIQEENEVFLSLYKILSMGLILVLIISYLIMLAIQKIINKVFISPLQKIGEGVRHFSFGALDYKIHLETGDELEDLAVAFNNMTRQLEKTTVSKDYLDNIIGTMTDSLIVIDPDLKIVTANKAACAFLGYQEAELTGKDAGILFPEDENIFKNAKLDRFIKEKVVKNYEVNYRSKDGKKNSVLLSVAVLKKQDNLASKEKGERREKILGAVCVAKDIAELKKARDKLNQALRDEIKSHEIMVSMLDDNNQIREQLEKSLKSLKASQDLLIHAEKMEAVGRMASSVAHEVKSPLGTLLQGINYFESKLPPEAKDNLEILKMMKASIKRADDIVRAMLDFSRAQELKIEPHDINTAINNAINLLQYKFKERSVECVRELGGDLPEVSIDAGKIEQVLINLLNNAADASSEEGKVYLRSYLSEMDEEKNKKWNIKSDFFLPKEKAVFVEVEDTGTGIDEGIIDKIFEPFFTTKSRAEGTGLGLSVVRSIIEMHKGLIAVESKKGQGTKFTIALKISEVKKD